MKPLLEYNPKDFQLVQDVNVVRNSVHDNIRVVWYRIEAEKFALPRYGCFILILSLLEPRLEALESYLRDCSFDSPPPLSRWGLSTCCSRAPRPWPNREGRATPSCRPAA
jgi:hypothetical protein